MMTSTRGALIIFEGLDRIGKTTQSKLLFDYLTRECGLLCERLAFPDRSTQIGSLIDDYLQRKIEFNDHTIHLLFSANRWECVEKIRTKLLQGYTLIIDRYAYSGVAFSQAKGLDKNWCQSTDIGLPKPDLVLYFSRGQSNSLSHNGIERYETSEFQQKVEICFEQFRSSSHEWKNINVFNEQNTKMRDRESIQIEVRQYVRDIYKQITNKNQQIEELWKEEEKENK